MSSGIISLAQIASDDMIGSKRKVIDGTEQLDSLGYNKVKSVIKTWKLSDFSSQKVHNDLDTVFGELQNYHPIFKQSISNSYLGNLGSPYQSNIYMDRSRDANFIFFTPFEAYLLHPEDVVYFNTTTPYTSIFYEMGGPKTRSENLLKFLHTQNVSPNWNVGLTYNLISSDGQYQNQDSKLYDLTLFSSYEKNRYRLNFVLNQNRVKLEENGGILNDTLLTGTNDKAENIQVNLDDTKNKLTNFNFFMNHAYGIGNGKEMINDQDTTYFYGVEVMYNFSFESNSRRFKENILNSKFYENNYFDSSVSFDKVEQKISKNTFQIVFNENENKWIRLGARFGIINEFEKYTARKPYGQYLLDQADKKIHNNQILASLYSNSGSSVNWEATGTFAFEGYNQNDFHLSYELIKWFGKTKGLQGLKVMGNLDSENPNYLLSKYYGNHQQWDLNLDKLTELKVGILYFNKNLGFRIGTQINQIKNYTYFGLDAVVKQTGSGINVLTGFVDKDFKIGNFHLNQKIVGQNSSDEQILPLPKFAIYSNNYYQNTFFSGALGIQTGFSVHYNTSFFAPDYMPATGQFFLQNEKKIVDYPKVDLYFNFRIKRTRIFIMYENASASLGSRNYFSTLHYPLNPAMVKYGLIWNFYN